MSTRIKKKMEILNLVEAWGEITFVDLDYFFREFPSSNDGEFELHMFDDGLEKLWVYYKDTNYHIVKELLETKAIVPVPTSSMTYANSKNRMRKTTSHKLMDLLLDDDWYPTVLQKGPNFSKEWERHYNDTSRKN